MYQTKVIKLREDLWALDEAGKTVMYVINGRKKALLIDTGLGLTDLKETVKALCSDGQMQKEGMKDKEILVVNTHGHGDHISGNNQFDRVYMGRFDEPDGHSQMEPEEKERMSASFLGEYFRNGGVLEDWNPGPALQVIPVSEGDAFDLGNYVLRVLETPGHSLGSITLFEEKQGWMFTGDLILTWEVWGQLPRSSALSVYGDSISRLAALQDQVTAVFPAHWDENLNPLKLAPAYELPPRVLSVYADGIRSILEGRAEAVDYPFPAMLGGEGPVMKCVYFEIGGMVYDPSRM